MASNRLRCSGDILAIACCNLVWAAVIWAVTSWPSMTWRTTLISHSPGFMPGLCAKAVLLRTIRTAAADFFTLAFRVCWVDLSYEFAARLAVALNSHKVG